MRSKYKLSTKDVVDKIKSAHGNKFNLDDVNYINYRTKIKIICNIHGAIYVNPGNAIKKNWGGCKRCSCTKVMSKRIISFDNFCSRIEKKCLLQNVSVINNSYSCINSSVKFLCNKHGEFCRSRAIDAINSKFICPKCSRSGHGIYNATNMLRGKFNNISGAIYLLFIHSAKKSYTKVGICKLENLTQRISNLKSSLKNFDVRLLDYVSMPLAECILFEKKISNIFENLKEDIGIKFGGHTEIYSHSLINICEAKITNLLEYKM